MVALTIVTHEIQQALCEYLVGWLVVLAICWFTRHRFQFTRPAYQCIYLMTLAVLTIEFMRNLLQHDIPIDDVEEQRRAAFWIMISRIVIYVMWVIGWMFIGMMLGILY